MTSNTGKKNTVELSEEQFNELARYIQQIDIGRTRAMQTLDMYPQTQNDKRKTNLKFGEVVAQVVGTAVAIIVMVIGISVSYYSAKEDTTAKVHAIKEDIVRMNVVINNDGNHIEDINEWVEYHKSVCIDKRDLSILEKSMKMYIDTEISDLKSFINNEKSQNRGD